MSNRIPYHKPLSAKPLTKGGALKELMDILKCECDMDYKFKVEMRLRIQAALEEDLKDGRPGPSKQECEWMVYGKEDSTSRPEIKGFISESAVPADLKVKFPKTVALINELMN